MAFVLIRLPDDLVDLAHEAGLDLDLLAERAIVAELDRPSRMGELGDWLDELDEAAGPPSAAAVAEAEAWARSSRRVRKD